MIENPYGDIYAKSLLPIEKRPVPETPFVVDVELVNTCNFKCKMCPTGKREIKRPKGFMKTATYTEIITQCKNWKPKPYIRFVRWGEPTLHKGLFTFIREAHKRGMKTHFNTNGYTLDDKMIEQIVSSKLDSIKFSFQGYDWMEYEEYRGRDFYNILAMKARQLKEYRSRFGDKPYIVIGTTVEKPVKARTEFFQSIMADSADLVTVGQTRDLDEVPENPPVGCREVFDKMSIDWDGTVVACCGDYDRLMVIGNIHQNTLKEIWHGEKLNKIREMLRQGRHSELPLCRHCIGEGVDYDT